MTRSTALALLALLAPPLSGRAAESGPAAARPVGRAKVILQVEGLSCATCNLAVRRALQKTAGVLSVEAGAHQEEAVVTFDGSKVRPEQLVEAVDKAGFKASARAGADP